MRRPRRELVAVWGAVLFALALLTPVLSPFASGASSPGPSSQSVVIGSIPLPASGQGLALDGANGDVYLSIMSNPNQNGSVRVISGANNTVVGAAPVGWEPGEPVIDTASGNVYVSNFDPGCTPSYYCSPVPPPTVSVISGATNTVLATITTGGGPSGATFDPLNGNVYVLDDQGLAVISGMTNTLVSTVSLPPGAAEILVDRATGNLYVSDGQAECQCTGPNALTVVSGSTNNVTATIPIGSDVGPMLFDPVNQQIYVESAGAVAIVSGATNSMVGSLPSDTGQPSFVNGSGDVYFLQPGDPANVSVVSSASNTVIARYPVGTASGMTYDSGNGDLYTVSQFGTYVNVTSPGTHQQLQSVFLQNWNGVEETPVYDPGNGDLYVLTDRNVVVISGAAPIPSGPAAAPLITWTGVGIGLIVGVLLATAVVILSRGRRRRNAPP